MSVHEGGRWLQAEHLQKTSEIKCTAVDESNNLNNRSVSDAHFFCLSSGEWEPSRTTSKRVYVQTWLKPDPVSWGQNLTAPCWSTEWEYTLRAEVSTPDVPSKINLKMRGDGHVGADDLYWTKRCVFTTLNYILSSLQQTATFWENTEFDERKPKIPKWLVSHRGPRVFISSKKNSHEGNRRGRGFTSVLEYGE